MPTLSEIRQRTVAAVDSVHAETVYLSFLKDHAVDPDRDACEIEAVLRVGSGEESTIQGGRAQTWQTRIAAGKAELYIDRGKYPGLVLRTGDRLRAIDRVGKPWFSVSRVDDRGIRLVAELGEL